MNSKTPVSVLQEVTMKSLTLPLYTEISREDSSKNFTIRANWRCYTTKGIGSTKKIAKHNAAMEMLLLLVSEGKIPESTLSLLPNTRSTSVNFTPVHSVTSPETISSPVSVATVTTPFENYVGQLQEYCQIHGTSLPLYEEVNRDGLPHQCMFTVHCTVDSVCKEGSATTKKMAKHKAAQEVLRHLTENPPAPVYKDNEFKHINVSIQEIISRFTRKTRTEVKAVSPHLVRDCHIVLGNLFKEKINNYYTDDVLLQLLIEEEPGLQKLKDIICHATDATILSRTLENKNQKHYVFALKVTTIPAIVQISTGATIKAAELHAYRKIVQSIFQLGK